MEQLVDWITRNWFEVSDPASWEWYWAVALAGMLVAAVIGVVFIAIFAGPVTWVERRTASRIQSRIGPNRVGPQGVLQWLADGLKCFLKEDLVPDAADRPLFRLAPYLVFMGLTGTFVVLPFGANIIAADLNVGLLYLMAITSLVVVGLLMSGWASNSKWALYGGIRSAAQLVSYEIPTAFALLVVVLAAGTLSTQGIIHAQGGLPWEWFVCKNPFSFIAFFLFFVASLAEGNRVPFDLPEAESELVAGYNTEYSGMRYLFFMFAEWANLWVMGAIANICFLGGWQIPFVAPEYIAAQEGLWFWALQLISFAVFMIKTSWIVFIIIQIRWTLPRPRVDQMMITCWKYLVPLCFVCVIGVLVFEMVLPEPTAVNTSVILSQDLWERGHWLNLLMRMGLSGVGGLLVLYFFWRARHAYVEDRDTYKGLRGEDPWYPPYYLP